MIGPDPTKDSVIRTKVQPKIPSPLETVSQSSSFIRQATTNGCRRGALKIPLYPPLKKRRNFLQPVLIPHDPIALPLFEKEGLGEICVRRKANNTLRHRLLVGEEAHSLVTNLSTFSCRLRLHRTHPRPLPNKKNVGLRLTHVSCYTPPGSNSPSGGVRCEYTQTGIWLLIPSADTAAS
jgi:hypothetical protein